ncbi:MAG: 1-acyl-sn-glycerol-3-phosphate acyltransferase [Herpetosiphonaceae bacterium]|nr:1-acyl-sn-glycerol-3-phosphate acyltransferase [Herpetosiphonaceae bacterium]
MTIVLQTDEPRLPARPNRFGAWLVYRGLVRPALRSTFKRILLDAGPADSVLAGSDPVLCYVTHTSWWDGYLAFELFRQVYPRQHFLMMEEAQLRRYFFFRWCGCFSVDRADAREAVRSLRYAARLLATRARPLVWLFPQGLIRPADQRPLELYRGAAEIATRAAGVWCVPIALRYEFGPEQRPDALIAVGDPLWVGQSAAARTVHATLAERLSSTADSLRDRWIAGDLAAFQPILQGKQSANRVFDAVLGPLIRRWTGKNSR